jgi:hypothetical protein
MELWEDLQAANKTEPYFVELIQRLQEESAQMQNFSQRDGHLFFKGQFVINPTCSLKSTLLQEFHNSKIGGHLWVLCTFKRVSLVFHWLAMKKDVETYVSSCEVCQKIKNDHRSPAGLLKPFPVPLRVWEDISLDFIDGLPYSAGKNSIIVAVNCVTRYAHLVALAHPYLAKRVV